MRIGLLLCLVVGLVSASELDLLTAAPRRGQLVEWRIPHPDPAWLGTDTAGTPRLIITDPAGVEVARAAYLHQEYRATPGQGQEFAPVSSPELRVRHRCDVAGTHRLRLLPPGGGAPLAEAELSVADAPFAGLVGISRSNQRLLAHRDGTAFVPVSVNVAWAASNDRLGQIERYFRRFAEAGGRHVRLWCASWSGQIEGERPDAYRLDQAWLLDRMLLMAAANGLHVTLVLDNHHDVLRGLACPYGGTFDERVATFFADPVPPAYARRLRYLAARYGALANLLAWELFNELDLVLAEHPPEGQTGEQTALRWVAAAGRALREADVDRHLVTVSMAHAAWPDLNLSPALDLVQFHAYVPPIAHMGEQDKDGVGLLASEVAGLLASRRPFCFSEVGFQGTNDDNPGNDADTGGFLLRQQAWAGLLLGGYGSGMAWWWDVHIDRRDLWQVYRPLADTIARIDWRDATLQPFVPNLDSSLRVIGWQGRRQALIWPQSRADTWHNLLIQRRDRPRGLTTGPALRLDGLEADHPFAVTGYSMVDGQQRFELLRRTGSDGYLVIVLPPEHTDLVLVVKDN